MNLLFPETAVVLPAPFDHQLFEGFDYKLVQAFIEWHQANPDVYREFESMAKTMHRKGRARYSQWTLVNALRWKRDLHTTGDEFKINNNWIALLARLFVVRNPSMSSFFELRTKK